MIRALKALRSRVLQLGNPRRYLLYAAGEIVLIVIGILIATSINGANVARSDRMRETKYLRNIRLDLQKDLESLRYNIEFRERRIQSAQRLLAQIGGAPVEDLDRLAKDVILTLWEERFTPSNVTVRDLIGSGNMNLITDEGIKAGLFELEQMYGTNSAFIDHETYEYREFTAKQIYRYVDMQRAMDVFMDNATAAKVGLVAADFAELLKSVEYKNGCAVAAWTSEEFRGFYEKVRATSSRVIAAIDAELKIR
jgi:hypothetical protein